MKKIKKLFSFIFLLFVTLTFAESEIPHQIISENPNKEVTTIESKKLKEKAELDIVINKITPIEIQGVIIPEGKTVYKILKTDEEKNLLNTVKNKALSNTNDGIEYFITENLSQILNNRGRRSLSTGIDYKVVENKEATSLTVNTDQPVYIVKLRDGVMENVFRGSIRGIQSRELEIRTTPIKYVEAIFGVGIPSDDKSYKIEYDLSKEVFIGNSKLKNVSFSLEDGNLNIYGDAKRILPMNDSRLISLQNNLNIHMNISSKAFINVINFAEGVNNPGNLEWSNVSGSIWESRINSGNILASDILKASFYSEGNPNGLDGQVDIIGGKFQIRSSIASIGIYEYTPNITVDYIDSTDDSIKSLKLILPTYIVASRPSKSFYITPKLEKMSMIDIENYIFEEYNSQIENSETLPTDWYYGYDDSNEGIQDEYTGLYLDIIPTEGVSVERKGKRHLVFTCNDGSKVEVYLENEEESGRARLKYKILQIARDYNFPSVSFKVKYVAFLEKENYKKTLIEDKVTIYIPVLNVVKEMKLKLDYRLRQLDGYFNSQGDYYKNKEDFIGISQENYSELVLAELLPEGLPEKTIVNAITNYIKVNSYGTKDFYHPYDGKEEIVVNNKENWNIGSDFVKEDIYVYLKNQVGNFTPAELYLNDYSVIKLEVNETDYSESILNSGGGTLIMDLAAKGDSIIFPMGGQVENEQNKILANKDLNDRFIVKDFFGKFPNTAGLHTNKNIVDNLDIKIGDAETTINYKGKIYETPDYRIELVEGTGDLKITKLSNEKIDETIGIAYKYGRVKLGDFTLRIVNNSTENIGLIIEEDVSYDFGVMVGGEKYNLENSFRIKNLNNQKVTKVDIPIEAVMKHINDETKQIPLKIYNSTRIIENTQDIETIIGLEATPEKGQTAGEYTGSFDITITIDETTN